ncbi:alpha-glucan water dikinase 1, putative [Eimeria brunetti]|uniref:Alpha-glucan water dikinase 1, putative n=1 Tax=Eimeria brunetti TaxID=51314 RepID=U6LCJ4_9EIME|nr:alpha-glucan water dikinase 1, putative [Eimeria brunetti]
MANKKREEKQKSLPPVEDSEADEFLQELPVDGGRTLTCRVRRRRENANSDEQVMQVLLSFNKPFFGGNETSKELLLHWGVGKNPGDWLAPDGAFREQLRCGGQPVKFGDAATDIPFPSPSSSPHQELELSFPADVAPDYMVFVLHSPPHEWFKQPNPGRPSTNFVLPLKKAIKQMGSRSAFLKAVAAYRDTQPLEQIKPAGTRYWRIAVNDGNMQLLALTFVDKECCGLELFCDWPAALLLHWGTAESQSSTWKRMELNKMLMHVDGGERLMQQGRQQEHSAKHKREDSEKLPNGVNTGHSGKKCNTEEGQCPEDSSAGKCHLQTLYGTFAHYPIDNKASQTLFEFCETSRSVGFQRVALCFRGDAVPCGVSFVLKEVKADRWFADQTGDFFIKLPTHPYWETLREKYRKLEEIRAAQEAKEIEERRKKWNEAKQAFNKLAQEQNPEAVLTLRRVPLSDGVGELLVKTVTDESKQSIVILITACLQTPCVLRWGMVDIMGRRQTELQREAEAQGAPAVRTGKGGRYQWICPPPEVRPPHTVVADPLRACETPFEDCPDGLLQHIEIHVPALKTTPHFEGDPGVEPLFDGFACCLRERDADRWYKAIDNRDIQVRLLDVENMPCKGENREYLEKIVEAEVEWQHMTLMHRYNLMRDFYESFARRSEARLASSPEYAKRSQRVSELARGWSHRQWEGDEAPLPEGFGACMNKAQAAHDLLACGELAASDMGEEKEFWELMFTWARFAFLGLLDWQRNYNTKPRELAHACESLTFYTAVIVFLESRGDLSAFWRVLSDHGITRERLASYERKITMEPHMVHTDINELINDFRAYLSVIQDVHDARDARKAFDYARGYLPGDTAQVVERVVSEMGHRTDSMGATEIHNRFARLSEARRRICFQLNENGGLNSCDDSKIAATRELLMLDFVLEQQQGLLLQATASFNVQQLAMHLRELVLCLSAHDPFNVELTNLCADWQHLSGDLAASCACGDSSNNECREGALLLKALSDRLSRFVGKQVDSVQEGLGPKAQYLGAQVGTDKKVLDFFVDEILRGSSLLSISFSIKRLEPLLRKAARLPAWQLISVVERVRGEFVTINELSGIQDKVFGSPTILLCNAVSGEEEIPEGVQAVLVRSAAVSPDILSHVAVRARNAHVLLAVCFDEAESGKLEELAGQWVEVQCTRDGSSLSVAAAPKRKPDSLVQRTCSSLFDRKASQLVLETREEEELRKSIKQADKNVAILDASRDAPWAISAEQFTSTESWDCYCPVFQSAVLRPRAEAAGDCFCTTSATFQLQWRTLHAPENVETLKTLSAALRRLSIRLKNSEAQAIFEVCQKAIASVAIPRELRQALEEALRSSDAKGGDNNSQNQNSGNRPLLMDLWKEAGDAKCTQALVEVWASLFGLRPWVSLTKASRDYCELNMAVLVQELLPVRYSFVLHTKNPFSQDQNELYGEIAPGLGEVIVGNYAGRALGWTQTRNGEPRVVAFPSKSIALTCKQCLIFRSDSNGEDLEGFAGAGLFESIPAERAFWLPLCYWRQRLVSDRTYRRALLSKISKVGMLVEDIYGAPQDIEGVVIGEDTIALVQTRPQV